MRVQTPKTHAAAGQRGFSLLEMVITLAILVVVMLGALALFDMASSLSRVQLDVADMQQSLRSGQYDMVRLLRMSGRGSVPAQVLQPPLPAAAPVWTFPKGIAVEVRNKAGANEYMDAPANTKKILPETDVLTVRGVFSSPVCTVVKDTFTVDNLVGSPTYGRGQLRVINQALPNVPVPQNLKRLAEAIAGGVKEALMLVSGEDDSIFQVVELDPGASNVDNPANPTNILVAFKFDGGTNTAGYLAFSGGTWNSKLKEAAYMGIIEEYKFYVLDEREIIGDVNSPPKPRLVRAQVFPGTQSPYKGDVDNWSVGIADNVADLQVALGIQNGGVSPFDLDDNGNATDEWLFNAPGDVNGAGAPVDPNKWRFGKLYYVRLSTTVFSERRDRTYALPANVTSEDHTYVVPSMGTAGALTPDRTYRRRTIKTVVDLRNL